MGALFSPLIGFPFTWELTGRIDATDTGDGIDVSGVRDPVRANALMISNAGPNIVAVNVGGSTVAASLPSAGNVDGEGWVVLAGAIIIIPCPHLSDCTVAAATDAGETATVFVSRGWGQ
jgi:hypothetical protein